MGRRRGDENLGGSSAPVRVGAESGRSKLWSFAQNLLASLRQNWENRIVGGSSASSGQFPYQISLRNANNAHFCGGFLINTRFVVSAAHCTRGRSLGNTMIIAGALNRVTGGFRWNTARINNHPQYNANTLAFDVSVLMSSSTISQTATIRPIGLSSTHLGGGVSAVVTGWGQTSHPGSAANTLQFLNVQTISNQACASAHGGNGGRIFAHKICTHGTAGRGTCMGDSGGPLAVGNSCIGIVSWGIACARGFPDVFDRVSSHRNWIIAQF
ncbi:trypsin alpha-3-like [Phlebotomus argentipes]|uniref:trypsin alpha-3-like n=1 Tax=Phlebotomus argentipes TaxID=94469 RepID=UPI002892F3BF|nr:trypsin alpha-3-like [Phlebotomus argentipes]